MKDDQLESWNTLSLSNVLNVEIMKIFYFKYDTEYLQ